MYPPIADPSLYWPCGFRPPFVVVRIQRSLAVGRVNSADGACRFVDGEVAWAFFASNSGLLGVHGVLRKYGCGVSPLC